MNPIDSIPIKITAYFCVVCKKVHRRWSSASRNPSVKFREHYEVNRQHYGWKNEAQSQTH